MPRSPSEAFLLRLAEKTFLKLWTVPNSFYAPNKELTDLIIPFGEDIVIISDKACRFAFDKPLGLAWSRWRRDAIDDSLRQLKTAMQRVERDPEKIFTDVQARSPLGWPVAQGGQLRFHLVAVARPDNDPEVVPPQWPGLSYAPDTAKGDPFRIGKIAIGDQQVHVFDGSTMDLLLSELDTAPDFIAYLTGRSKRLAEATEYEFREYDLLGASLIGWDFEPTRLPSVPPLEAVVDGLWDMFNKSESARRRREADRKGRIIDAIIEHQHSEFSAGRMLYEAPSPSQHEQAMRLLATESRFARRIVAHELHDILDEPDQSTFWASTVLSPTMPWLRYVWLVYPESPDEISEADCDRFLLHYLKQHVLVAQGLFEQTLVLGTALPNRSANDTAIFAVLHDGSNWTDEDREEALKLQDDGVFSRLEANDRVHIP